MKKFKAPVSTLLFVLTILITTVSFSAEQTQKEKDKARCAELLKLLDEELELAQVDIIADAGPISHATSLLAGASIGYQFGRFKGCIDKTTRGRQRIAPLVKNAKKKGLKTKAIEDE
ncbi:MAG: hypothetical protein ACC635_04760 [Acidiferrobacterales bacterium]